MAFDCTSQDTAAHGDVVNGVQEASKTASKGAKNGTFCPGKERCAVIYLRDEAGEIFPVGHVHRHRKTII